MFDKSIKLEDIMIPIQNYSLGRNLLCEEQIKGAISFSVENISHFIKSTLIFSSTVNMLCLFYLVVKLKLGLQKKV